MGMTHLIDNKDQAKIGHFGGIHCDIDEGPGSHGLA